MTNLNKKPDLEAASKKKYMTLVKSTAATLLISIVPVFVIVFLPLQPGRESDKPLLKILLGFTAGGLLGDVFLHLLPHSTAHGDHGHSHDHEHDHHHHHDNSVGMWVLTGIITFFVIEKIVRIATGSTGHSHSHSHTAAPKQKDNTHDIKNIDGDNKHTTTTTTKDTTKSTGPGNKKPTQDGKKPKQDDNKNPTQADDKKPPKQGEDKKLKKAAPNNATEELAAECNNSLTAAAILNLVADWTHNFTDGLAIGASFATGQNLGISTTLAVLLHELPHEIGDYAILIQSGMSRRRATLAQLSTATGALLGCVAGVMLEGDGEKAGRWVLPLTAGGFVYIACTAVLPELLNSGLVQSIWEVLAMLLGVAFMVGVAAFEEHNH